MKIRQRVIACVGFPGGVLIGAVAACDILSADHLRARPHGDSAASDEPDASSDAELPPGLVPLDGGTTGPDGGASLDATTGCTWCLSHLPKRGRCWDFDCIDADDGPLLLGWFSSYEQNGGKVGLGAGRNPDSMPNAFRSTLPSLGTEQIAVALLGQGFDTFPERIVAFDLKRVSCSRTNKRIVLVSLQFLTGSGAGVISPFLRLDPNDDLVAGVFNDEQGTQQKVVLMKVPSDWIRIHFGVSRPTTTATITVAVNEEALWSTSIQNVASDTRLTLALGLQPDQNSAGTVQGCEFLYDNVVVDFPP